MPTQKKLTTYLKFLQQPRGFTWVSKASLETKKLSKLEAIKKLYTKYKNCHSCPLAQQGRLQVVFGTGSINAQLMFIGEAPGKDENIQGQPFVGRSGQLLTKIIETMGLSREDVYISNIVKCRPPDNRTPLINEINTCKKLILLKEINLIKPKIICTLGTPATQGLLGNTIKISEVRGKLLTFKTYPVIPTYHPAYLLRNPSKKKIVLDDMQKIMNLLKNKI